MTVRIDELDRKILRELQADASQSLDDIAKTVGSSKTPVWNRIRKLREAGVIGQQTVLLDPEKQVDQLAYSVHQEEVDDRGDETHDKPDDPSRNAIDPRCALGHGENLFHHGAPENAH